MFNEFSRYEQQFTAWRRDGYPGIKQETFKTQRNATKKELSEVKL